jgi:hypothetical protein
MQHGIRHIHAGLEKAGSVQSGKTYSGNTDNKRNNKSYDFGLNPKASEQTVDDHNEPLIFIWLLFASAPLSGSGTAFFPTSHERSPPKTWRNFIAKLQTVSAFQALLSENDGLILDQNETGAHERQD